MLFDNAATDLTAAAGQSALIGFVTAGCRDRLGTAVRHRPFPGSRRGPKTVALDGRRGRAGFLSRSREGLLRDGTKVWARGACSDRVGRPNR